MVKDLIKNTIINLKVNKINTLKDVYLYDQSIVCFSKKYLEIEKEIRFFLRTKMYNNRSVLIKNNKGKKIIRKLFLNITKNPKSYLTKDQLRNNKYRAIADFISGMTDRYAINLYKNSK